jgi:dynein heavy chain
VQIFEVADLAYASPATVSRCGMVYMEPGALGIRVLIESWLQEQAKVLAPQAYEAFAVKINALLEIHLQSSIDFVHKNMKEPVTTTNSNLTRSLFKILESLASPYRLVNVQAQTENPIDLDSLGRICDCLFAFALVWSVGTTANAAGRKKFDQFLRAKLAEMPLSKPIPAEGSVHDYKFDLTTNEWVHWMTDVPTFSGAKSAMVNTIDTVRYSYLLDLLAREGNHMLCIGPTGTGKSLIITEKMLKGMEAKFVPLIVNFSARTSANQTQDFIDSKLDKRRKGVFGPPMGKKMIIFIDDLNM